MLSQLNYSSIFKISFVFVVLFAIFSVGFHHPDEQYYAIDFAAYKLGILTQMPSWEYQTELRPWALPTIFTPILFTFHKLGFNSFQLAFVLRLVSGLFGFFSLSYFVKNSKRYFHSESLYQYFFLFAHLSFFIPFFLVRTNSENWGTSFFILGFSIVLKNMHRGKNIFWGSFILGVSFLMRHQIGFLVFGFGIHLLIIQKFKASRWAVEFVLPMILIFLMELALDSWGYNHLSFSPFNYIYENLILGKVNNFGTHPIWFYFVESIKKLGPYGLFFWIGLMFFIIKKPNHVFIWTIFPFLLIHHLIGHKELRFLYPISPLLFVMGFMWIGEKELIKKIWFQRILKGVFVLNFLILVFLSFKPAYTPMGFYKALYDTGESEIFSFVGEGRVEPILEMEFYKKNGLIVTSFNNALEEKVGLIWTTKYQDLMALLKRNDCKLLYSTYPIWILKINFGRWRERSNIWSLTKCGPRS